MTDFEERRDRTTRDATALAHMESKINELELQLEREIVLSTELSQTIAMAVSDLQGCLDSKMDATAMIQASSVSTKLFLEDTERILQSSEKAEHALSSLSEDTQQIKQELGGTKVLKLSLERELSRLTDCRNMLSTELESLEEKAENEMKMQQGVEVELKDALGCLEEVHQAMNKATEQDKLCLSDLELAKAENVKAADSRIEAERKARAMTDESNVLRLESKQKQMEALEKTEEDELSVDEDKLQIASAEKQKLQDELISVHQRETALGDDEDRTRKELEILQHKCTELEKKKRFSQGALRSWFADLQAVQNEKEHLQTTGTEISLLVEKQLRSIEMGQRDLEDEQTEVNKTIAMVEVEVDELQEKAVDEEKIGNDSLASVKKQQNAIEHRLKEANDKLKGLTEQHANAEQNLQAAQHELHGVVEELSMAKKKLSVITEKQTQQCRDEIDSLSHRLKESQTSTSYMQASIQNTKESIKERRAIAEQNLYQDTVNCLSVCICKEIGAEAERLVDDSIRTALKTEQCYRSDFSAKEKQAEGQKRVLHEKIGSYEVEKQAVEKANACYEQELQGYRSKAEKCRSEAKIKSQEMLSMDSCCL